MRLATFGGLIVALTVILMAWFVVWRVEAAMTARAQGKLEINFRVAQELLRERGGDGPLRIDHDRLVAPNGRVLDGDTELVDRIRDIAGGTATLFRGDLRVTTNVQMPDGTRAIGTHLARSPVYNTVLHDGRTFRGEADILGTTYITAYEPLKDARGEIIGILYVGVKKADFFAIITEIKIAAILGGVALILAGGGLIFLAVRHSFRPLDDLRGAMGALAAGQLETAVPSVLRADEIGRMARAVQVFQQTAVDFAESKAAELRDAHRIAQVGTWRHDLVTGAIAISDEMHSLLGTDPHVFVPTPESVWSLVHLDDRAETELAFARAIAGEKAIAHECRMLLATGETSWLRVEAQVETDDSGLAVALRGVCQNVTDRHDAADRIYWLAHHDALTGLPNRELLRTRLSCAVSGARKTDKPVAVFCLDLDGFKAINDLNGHPAGDILLCEVAARLRRSVRDTDTVSRIGGDEFVVVQEGPSQPDATRGLVERLLAVLAKPYDLGAGVWGQVTVSVGVALFPADGRDPETLLRNADTALYRAKRAGKNGAAFFHADMDTELRERRVLERDLWRAVEQQEFRLVWQPIANTLPDGQVMGFEVLLRWQHPERGLLSPDLFIPIAEACNAIIPIGMQTLREACYEAASWAQPLSVSVNVSPLQVQQGEAFAEQVTEVLTATGLDATRLILEVTESVLIRDPGKVLLALGRLQSVGVQVALDDFGTGYSSLATLRAFPFDRIKIDKRFVAGIADDGQDAAIVRAVLGLARGLSLPVVAEGVETPAQLAALRNVGCEYAQGWLIGRPAMIANFTNLTGVDVAAPAAA